jgi:hypothetical protein
MTEETRNVVMCLSETHCWELVVLLTPNGEFDYCTDGDISSSKGRQPIRVTVLAFLL